jgi:hypothetical protein
MGHFSSIIYSDYYSGAALSASTFFDYSPWREVFIRVINESQ